jgi:hypothetical protein
MLWNKKKSIKKQLEISKARTVFPGKIKLREEIVKKYCAIL